MTFIGQNEEDIALSQDNFCGVCIIFCQFLEPLNNWLNLGN